MSRFVMQLFRRTAIGAGILGLSSVGVMAATATSTFQVTANVQATCQISTTNMAFGNYSGIELTATSTITVNCTQNQGYDIGLNGGSNSLPVTARKMTGPGGTVLNYALFRDSNHSNNWGNTNGSDVHGTGNGASQTLTVYGKLAASQLVTPGAYSDTITATITY